MLPPIFFSTFAVFCLVILCKGRVSLGLLSRSNNLETQKCLWTLTSSRAAGDSDFTEGKRLFWTWTDQNSSFTTIPITLISMVPYSSMFHLSWYPGTGRRELVSEAWKMRWTFQHKPHLCQAPAPTAGQWHLCHLPLFQEEGRLQTHSKHLTAVWPSSQCLTKEENHAAFTFPACGGGYPVSASLPNKKTPHFQTRAMTGCKMYIQHILQYILTYTSA